MEKSWNFVKPQVARKLAVGHTSFRQLVFWLLVTGGFKFNYFKTYAWSVYKHAIVAAFRIYDQRGEDAAKRGGWRLCIK